MCPTGRGFHGVCLCPNADVSMCYAGRDFHSVCQCPNASVSMCSAGRVFQSVCLCPNASVSCCRFGALNPINFLEGFYLDLGYIIDITPFDTKGDLENYIARLEARPAQVSCGIEHADCMDTWLAVRLVGWLVQSGYWITCFVLVVSVSNLGRFQIFLY